MYFSFYLALFLTISSQIPTENENVRLKLALTTGAPITVANDAMEMLSLAADKAIKDLTK